jgi:hypothetical protein
MLRRQKAIAFSSEPEEGGDPEIRGECKDLPKNSGREHNDRQGQQATLRTL